MRNLINDIKGKAEIRGIDTFVSKDGFNREIIFYTDYYTFSFQRYASGFDDFLQCNITSRKNIHEEYFSHSHFYSSYIFKHKDREIKLTVNFYMENMEEEKRLINAIGKIHGGKVIRTLGV